MTESATTDRPCSETAEGARLDVVWALLGLSGVVLVLLCTWRYGAGTSPDSSLYVSAARSLLAGKGYLATDGQPCTTFPPLFSTLIALAALPGEDALTAAQFLNALAFGGIVFLSGRLFQMCTTSAAFAVVGTLSVLLSGELLDVSSMIWSEPVFVLLTLLFLLLMTRLLRTRGVASLVLASVVAALAWLERYAGVPVIVAGGLLLGLGPSGASLRQRFRYLLCFGLISAGPMALWFGWNMLCLGRAGTPRWEPWSVQRLARTLTTPLNVVAEWFVPGSGALPLGEALHLHGTYCMKWFGAGSASSPVRVIGVAVVVLLVGVALVGTCRRRIAAGPAPVTPRGPVVVFLLTYLGFLAACGARTPQDLFIHRYLAPAYVPLALLALVGIETVFGWLGHLLARPEGGKSLGLLLCSLWLLYPLDVTRSHFRYCRRHGVCGSATRQWQRSPLMEWLRNHPVQGRLYSNAPYSVYLLTGIEVETTPPHWWDASEFARRKLTSQTSYIVWLHDASWSELYDLRELRSRYRMQEVAAFPEGCVYQYLGEGGPAVSAVYRFWSPQLGRHFYTIQKAERDRWLRENDGAWQYEGPVFHAFAPDRPRPAEVLPVYELRSGDSGACFYTMNQPERDRLLEYPAGAWTCTGVAFYAWPQPGVKDVLPVHRFWSEPLRCHFYTIDEKERTRLVSEFSQTWTYEGVAWYAYGP